MNRSLLFGVLTLLLLHQVPLIANEPQYGLEPFGKMVQVDHYKLHINCLGTGKPAVIFDSGLGGFSMDWIKVQKELLKDTTVCAYDRAGYGWSEEGPSPRVTDQIVDEFHELLVSAEVEPPYILVGHSFGGYNVQYYSKLYPKRVAGLVLIESSHPNQFSRLPDIPAQAAKDNLRNRLMTMFDASVLKKYPEEHRVLVGRFLTSSKSIRTQQREFLNFTQSGVQVGEIDRTLDVPLVVVTRAKRVWKDTPYGEQQEKIWLSLQEELLDLSTDSKQVFAEFSGHSVHLEQPIFVADVIRGVINKVCEVYPNYISQNDDVVLMCQNSIPKT